MNKDDKKYTWRIAVVAGLGTFGLLIQIIIAINLVLSFLFGFLSSL